MRQNFNRIVKLTAHIYERSIISLANCTSVFLSLIPCIPGGLLQLSPDMWQELVGFSLTAVLD